MALGETRMALATDGRRASSRGSAKVLSRLSQGVLRAATRLRAAGTRTFRDGLWIGLAALALAPTGAWAATRETAPAAYVFLHPEAKGTWREGLPADAVAVSPTCVYSKAEGTVYLLAELSGLGKGYETEFFLLGHLSDRAYEGLAVAWDAPSAVAKAVEALGVPKGLPARTLRGLGMAQGERFTVRLRRLGKDKDFRPLSDFVSDDCSTPAQALFARGFPYVGTTGYDDEMPAAVIAAYTEAKSLFGLPYTAPKGAVYGLFRATEEQEAGTPVVVALKWERLPEGQARVLRRRCEVTAETLAAPDAFLETLKALSEDPRDVFLDVRLAPSLKLREVARFARLLLAVEAQSGFTLDAPAKGQVPLRAFAPQAAWRERSKRVFQPWEIELRRGEAGVEATLCQILEDWTVEGPDPALTRKCYPGVTPQTLRDTMRKVDVSGGKIYVAFFYCAPEVTVGDLAPFAEAIR